MKEETGKNITTQNIARLYLSGNSDLLRITLYEHFQVAKFPAFDKYLRSEKVMPLKFLTAPDQIAT